MEISHASQNFDTRASDFGSFLVIYLLLYWPPDAYLALSYPIATVIKKIGDKSC